MHNEPYTPEKRDKTGIKRIVNAHGHSRDRLKAAYRHKSAFRQVCQLDLMLVILACIFDFNFSVGLLLITVSFISLIAGLLNIAVEAVVNHTPTKGYELAKRARDAGSTVQLTALILLTVTQLSVLWHTCI